MQQFSLVYNNVFVFLEPVDEPRPTYDCGQLMQGSSSDLALVSGNVVFCRYKGMLSVAWDGLSDFSFRYPTNAKTVQFGILKKDVF